MTGYKVKDKIDSRLVRVLFTPSSVSSPVLEPRGFQEPSSWDYDDGTQLTILLEVRTKFPTD